MAITFTGGSVSPFFFTPTGVHLLHPKLQFFLAIDLSLRNQWPYLEPVRAFWNWLCEEGVITTKTTLKVNVE